MRNKGNVYICAIGANSKTQPYISKLISTLGSLYITPHYVFWRRSSSDKPIDDGNIVLKELVFTRGSGKVQLAFGYLRWFFSLLFFAIKNSKEEDVFFVSRIDAALPIFLVSKYKRYKYVYLDRDPAFLSYVAPSYLLKCLRKIEQEVAIHSFFHFIPGNSRNYTKAKNVRVIPNTPSSTDLEAARELRGKIIREDSRFTVYINGWLKTSRGLAFILEAVKALSAENFRVIVVGGNSCKEADELCKLNSVTYLGQLSSKEALSIYYHSDIVLAFYDPEIPINQRVESNKWYDCLFTGTKFITNYGIETAEEFVEQGCGLRIKYGDVRGLINLLNKEASGREKTELNITQVFPSTLQPWDIQVGKLLSELLTCPGSFRPNANSPKNNCC